MSRWFRHYAGMMRDEKLVSVAVRSKQSVERVVWVWGAILESAAEINDGGRYDFDAGEAAYFLRCDEDELAGIVGGLQSLGRIDNGVIAKWSDRQFDSDGSKERQRRYRERQKGLGVVQERVGDAGSREGDVTQTSRDGDVTLQETDTDTDTDSSDANASSSPESAKAAPVLSPVVIDLPCVSGENYQVRETDVSEWEPAFPAVDIRQQLAVMRSWLNANQTRRKTRKGMRRFIVSWLERQQNSGHSQSPQNRATAPPKKTTQASIWTEEAIAHGIIDEPVSTENRRLGTSFARGQDQSPGFARRIASA
jgi:hypothetical protein